MQNFSFFEVPEKEAINVVKALSRAKWNGRKVVVEVSSEEGGKGHENGSSERKGGKRFGKGEDRTPRYDNKDRKTKDASTKGPKSGKKEKPSRAERGYSDARGPKRKTTGRNSLKTKNQTSVKKGGHAENQRNKNFQSKNHRIPLLREWFLLKKVVPKTFT